MVGARTRATSRPAPEARWRKPPAIKSSAGGAAATRGRAIAEGDRSRAPVARRDAFGRGGAPAGYSPRGRTERDVFSARGVSEGDVFSAPGVPERDVFSARGGRARRIWARARVGGWGLRNQIKILLLFFFLNFARAFSRRFFACAAGARWVSGVLCWTGVFLVYGTCYRRI